MAHLHRQAIPINPFLDDWLIHNSSLSLTLTNTNAILALAVWLGLIPSLEKSSLAPSQRIQFIGMDLDLVQGLVYPTRVNVGKMEYAATAVISATHVTARQLLSLLGMLNHLAPMIPMGRLHMRPIQLHLLELWRPSRGRLSDLVPVHSPLRHHLRWWLQRHKTLQGVPLVSPSATVSLFTDASLLGWGAHVEGESVAGTWTKDQSHRHINWLELAAVFLALKHFQHRLQHKCVLIHSDNTTVVAYINHQGGT